MVTKMSKSEALYREPPFTGEKLRKKAVILAREAYPCKNCRNYLTPGSPTSECKKVEGTVDDYGNCVFWTFIGARPAIRQLTKPFRPRA